jgi:hypothetical protein
LLNSYDRVWSYVGQGVALLSVSLAWYARSGAFPIIPAASAADDMRVSASYWGLLIDSGALLILGLIALRYTSRRPNERLDEPPWPRLVAIEEDDRDVLVSSFLFATIIGVPLLSWIVCACKYAESYITPRYGKTRDDALAQGFWSSRWEAFKHPLTSTPLHIYPPNGIEYIPWLTDVALVGLTFLAIFVWIRWSARIFLRQ